MIMILRSIMIMIKDIQTDERHSSINKWYHNNPNDAEAG